MKVICVNYGHPNPLAEKINDYIKEGELYTKWAKSFKPYFRVDKLKSALAGKQKALF